MPVEKASARSSISRKTSSRIGALIQALNLDCDGRDGVRGSGGCSEGVGETGAEVAASRFLRLVSFVSSMV